MGFVVGCHRYRSLALATIAIDYGDDIHSTVIEYNNSHGSYCYIDNRHRQAQWVFAATTRPKQSTKHWMGTTKQIGLNRTIW